MPTGICATECRGAPDHGPEPFHRGALSIRDRPSFRRLSPLDTCVNRCLTWIPTPVDSAFPIEEGARPVPFHFANVLIFSGLAIFFVLGSLLAGRLLRPNHPTAEKSMIYECGEKPIGHAWYNFNPRFYLIALVFVIFEVEIAFMFPVASVYKSFLDRGQGLLAFAEIFVFVAILAVGLAYVWAMGDIEWVKGLKQDVIKAAREKADAARKAA